MPMDGMTLRRYRSAAAMRTIQQRKAAGLCVQCGSPERVNAEYCERCRLIKNAGQRRRYHQRKAGM